MTALFCAFKKIIYYLLFRDKDHDASDAPRQSAPILFPVCRNCSTDQWKFRLSVETSPTPQYKQAT